VSCECVPYLCLSQQLVPVPRFCTGHQWRLLPHHCKQDHRCVKVIHRDFLSHLEGGGHHLLLCRGLEFATPMEEDADQLDAFHDDTPVHYRRVDNILGEGGSVPGSAERVLACAQRGRPWRAQVELQLVAGDMEPATSPKLRWIKLGDRRCRRRSTQSGKTRLGS
jgi:hypothetical protein